MPGLDHPPGTKAPKAAGKIHTDFERGFIRAEVVSFADLEACGRSMAAAKEKGLVRSEGKDYVMKDGDVVLFRSMSERKTVLITAPPGASGRRPPARFAQEAGGWGSTAAPSWTGPRPWGRSSGPWGSRWGSTRGTYPTGPRWTRWWPISSGLRPPGRAGVQRGPGPAGAVHRRHPGQLAPGAGGEPGRGVPLLPGGAAPHAPPEGGEAHHPVLHVGTGGGLLRGALLRRQGGGHRPDKGPGQGAGPLGDHGELRGPGSHRHGDERRPLPRRPWPSWRRTPPWSAWAPPEDVAQAIWFLASPAGDFFTGQVLAPNGGSSSDGGSSWIVHNLS